MEGGQGGSKDSICQGEKDDRATSADHVAQTALAGPDGMKPWEQHVGSLQMVRFNYNIRKRILGTLEGEPKDPSGGLESGSRESTDFGLQGFLITCAFRREKSATSEVMAVLPQIVVESRSTKAHCGEKAEEAGAESHGVKRAHPDSQALGRRQQQHLQVDKQEEPFGEQQQDAHQEEGEAKEVTQEQKRARQEHDNQDQPKGEKHEQEQRADAPQPPAEGKQMNKRARRLQKKQQRAQEKDQAAMAAKEAGLGVVKLGSMGIVLISGEQCSNNDNDSSDAPHGKVGDALSSERQHVTGTVGASRQTEPVDASGLWPVTAVKLLHAQLSEGACPPFQFPQKVLPVLATCAFEKQALSSLVERLSRALLPELLRAFQVFSKGTGRDPKMAAAEETQNGVKQNLEEGRECGENGECTGLGAANQALRFAVGFKRRGYSTTQEQGKKKATKQIVGNEQADQQSLCQTEVQGKESAESDPANVQGTAPKGEARLLGEQEEDGEDSGRMFWIPLVAAAFEKGAKPLKTQADLYSPHVACLVEVVTMAQGPSFCAISLLPGELLEVKPRLAVKSVTKARYSKERKR